MKDILIGFIIIVVGAVIIDFIYTEQNTCVKNISGGGSLDYKCGFLKKQLDYEIDFLDRFW